MDTVMQLEEVKSDLIEISFKLSFPKAREKMPATAGRLYGEANLAG
jgi:hypothetical protein